MDEKDRNIVSAFLHRGRPELGRAFFYLNRTEGKKSDESVKGISRWKGQWKGQRWQITLDEST